MSTHYRFTVPLELAGRRIDRSLAELNPGWTRSHARRLIDAGRVLVNGEDVKPATVVREGDVIEVDEPAPSKPAATPEPIPLDIVYEDDHLLVVNKSVGMVIHPAAGNPSGTLVNALLDHCADLAGIGGVERPGIVHRLDKDTSGLLVVAKSNTAHVGLSRAFRWRKVDKVYMAVCYGVPGDGEGVIDAPIDRHPRERRQMAIVSEGRPARTLYTVEQAFSGTALLSCRPVSGRTHQIRVHMAHVGHALVGDPLYAGRQWRNLSTARHRNACRSFPRQALHAWRLAFTHPATEQRVQFETPPPEDMLELIDTLRA